MLYKKGRKRGKIRGKDSRWERVASKVKEGERGVLIDNVKKQRLEKQGRLAQTSSAKPKLAGAISNIVL